MKRLFQNITQRLIMLLKVHKHDWRLISKGIINENAAFYQCNKCSNTVYSIKGHLKHPNRGCIR